MRRLVASLTVSCVLAIGCSGPSAFQRAYDSASQAMSRGAYAEAEAHWSDAERLAEEPRDQSEARYRRAMALVRAERLDDALAVLEGLQRDFPNSERAPRALLDSASLKEKQSKTHEACDLYERLVRTHAESGLATAGAERWLRCSSTEPNEQFQRLTTLLGERAWPAPLDEWLHYEQAKLLETLGRSKDALAAYRLVIERHPYPFGAHWDEALVRSAQILRAEGDAQGALRALDDLLRERESASLSGSSERERFAPSHFLKAEIYRDDLRDAAAARRTFREVFERYETSLLRDDALFQEALLAYRAEGPSAACSPLQLLVKHVPESRYAPCASELCPSLAKASQELGECRAYVLRTIDEMRAAPSTK